MNAMSRSDSVSLELGLLSMVPKFVLTEADTPGNQP